MSSGFKSAAPSSSSRKTVLTRAVMRSSMGRPSTALHEGIQREICTRGFRGKYAASSNQDKHKTCITGMDCMTGIVAITVCH
jgi:hypothetical protein